MRSITILATIAAFSAVASGCYDPELGETPFRCAADDGKKCPDGYTCRGNICVKEGSHDGGGSQPDMGPLTDAQLMPRKDGMVFIDGAPQLNHDTCEDSSTEPNDSASEATLITGSGTSTIPGWAICPAGDIDQFALELEEGQTIEVKVIFDHDRGDLDAALFDPDGFFVAAGRTSSDDELIRLVSASKSGTYILGVYGFGPVTNSYSLSISW